MTKRQLIDEIVSRNRTASPRFLARFDDEDLTEYLAHLRVLEAPRLSGNAERFAQYFRDLPTVANQTAAWRVDTEHVEEVSADDLPEGRYVPEPGGEDLEEMPDQLDEANEVRWDELDDPDSEYVTAAEREQLLAAHDDYEADEPDEFDEFDDAEPFPLELTLQPPARTPEPVAVAAAAPAAALIPDQPQDHQPAADAEPPAVDYVVHTAASAAATCPAPEPATMPPPRKAAKLIGVPAAKRPAPDAGREPVAHAAGPLFGRRDDDGEAWLY